MSHHYLVVRELKISLLLQVMKVVKRGRRSMLRGRGYSGLPGYDYCLCTVGKGERRGRKRRRGAGNLHGRMDIMTSTVFYRL